MKRKITLLFIAASAALSVNSQVVLTENFNSSGSTTLTAAGNWIALNASAAPNPTLTWFYGSTSAFNAYNGGGNNYIASNFQTQTSASNGTINNWLITPAVTIYDGAVFQFATRTAVTSGSVNVRPDRLQLLMSTTGATTGISSVSNGSFTDLLFDVNPSLGTSTLGTVVNGTATAGYPNVWTVYTVQVAGVSGTVTGRFAFRYYVTGATNSNTLTGTGVNSNYIGIDGVRYTLPCVPPVVNSYTTCANQPVTLTNVSNALPATNYTWTNGASSYTGTSINVNAGASGTTVYTVSAITGTDACGAPATTTASVTVGSNLSMDISAAILFTPICAYDNVTLTAISAASSYTWAAPGIPNYSNSAQAVVTPSANTSYTVYGEIGTFPNACQGSAVVNIPVSPLPNITVTQEGASCPGITFTLSPTGGIQYLWTGSNFPAALTSGGLALTGSTVSTGPRTYTVQGIDANGCIGETTGGYTIFPTPTLALSITNTVVCIKTTATIEASGAETYTWSRSGAASPTVPATSTVGLITFTATNSSATSNFAISVIGTDENGCVSGATTQQLKWALCTGLENISGDAETAVYPNPFTNELRVETLIGKVEIYNILGQMVLSVPVKENGTINTADMPKGTYVLKAYNEQGHVIKTTKLIKN